MQSAHDAKTKRVSKQVKDFYAKKQPFYIYHGSTNSTRNLTFRRDNTVDTSDFDEVLQVDTTRMTALVEPNVPMDKLVDATLAYGLVPPVVMEFPGITVGGGFQGGAGESSSFKYGGFNHSLNWFDIVLADGRQLRASPKNHRDLFFGAAGSFGTLGIMTAAEMQLVPAKRYIKLRYIHVSSYKEAVRVIQTEVKNAANDYVDGIMFAADSGVIMVGTLTDEKVGKVARFSRAHDEWFYLHAQKVSRAGKEYTESIPLRDYLFRYDRGGFWVGRFAYERANWPFNRFTRWSVNFMMKTRKLYQALHTSGASEQYIIQDLALPDENAAQFMQFIDTNFKTYPLWLCPLKQERESPLLCSNIKADLLINVGVWDHHPFYNYDEFVAANRKLEAKLQKLGGQKWFYAHAYYTEDEFWSIYDHAWYTKLRQKYAAETLPDVFEKVHTKSRKPVNIKKASFQTLFGLAKLKVGK